MTILIFAFLIGVVAGLRTMTAPAAVSWAAHLGWLHLENTWLGFLGATVTPYILTLLAVGELIVDKLPSTPSRKIPMQFGARIVMGAVCGTALTMPAPGWIAGMLAGVIGAVVGTLAGAEMRGRLSRAVGKNFPIALLEDVVAIGGAFLIVSRFA